MATLALAIQSAPLAERLPVRVITTADGLPSDQLTCARTDRRGFVWFCTEDGLARFDGYTAITFGRDEGLKTQGVRSFLSVSDGRYFIGADVGLYELNTLPIEGGARFRPILPEDDDRTGGVNALLESHDGTVWCGTGHGLLHLTTTQGRTRLVGVDVGLPRDFESNRIVHALAEDDRGTLWVGAGSGLYARRWDGQITRVTTAEGLPVNEIRALTIDADGRLWVGTREGLVLIDRDRALSGQAPIVGQVFGERQGLPGHGIRSLHADGQRMLVGTTAGLAQATFTSPGTLKVERTLTGFDARGIATDGRGDIWIATDSGARRLARQGFTSYSGEDGLPLDRVASVFETLAGNICTTILGSHVELSCFDGRGFERIRPSAVRSIQDPGWGWSQLALQDRRGDWWVPTGERLLRYGPGPPVSLASATPVSIFDRRRGLRSDSIFRVFEASNGDVWVATYAEDANGLARITPGSGEVHVFGPADGLPDDVPLAHAINQDKFGAVWVGFEEGRLFRYRTRFEEIPTRPLAPGQPRPTYDELNSILSDRRGRLWIASNVQGLGFLEDPGAESPSIKWYGKRQGLASDSVWTIVEDLSDDLFIGTGRGIDRFSPGTERVTHYTAEDGVPRGVISGALRDRTGRIWFATTNGIARFESEPAPRLLHLTTLITAIRLAGSPVAIRADAATRVDGITLQPGDRRIEIDFVSPGARAADGLRYQHQLAGVDRDWTTTDARTVALAGAAPGRYRFLVRSILASGVTSEPAEVYFTVLAPIWRRSWFIGLTIAGVTVLAYAFHRARVTRLLAVAQVRSRIASDLHDGVGANLSRIAILSEVARQQAAPVVPDVVPTLASIADNARTVIDDMSDAVWFIDPRLDNLQQLVARLRTTAAGLFEGHRIECTIDVPDRLEEISLGSEQRRQLYLILREALTNVYRHARATHVTVRLITQRGRLRVEVTDDGIGFNGTSRSSTRGSGRGLENMRARSAVLGGSLQVSSKEIGTSIVLDIALSDRMNMRLAGSHADTKIRS